MLSKAQIKELEEIVRLFEKAEKDLKKSEHLDTKLTIPCINELRYAGYHIAKATSNDNTDENLKKAVGHCKRAIYDANESAIVFLLERIATFQNDYSKSPNVSTIVLGYSKLKQEILEISERIQHNKKQNRDSRDQYYEACTNDCDRLKDIESLLNISRDEINVLEARDVKATRRFILGILISFISLALIATNFFISKA